MVSDIDDGSLWVGNGTSWHKLPFKQMITKETQTYTLDEYAFDGRIGFALNENKFTITFTDIIVEGTNITTDSCDRLLANFRVDLKTWMSARTLQIKVYYDLISDFFELRDTGEEVFHVFYKDMQVEQLNAQVNVLIIRKITFDLSATP